MLTTLLSRSLTVDATNPVTLMVMFEQIAGNWIDIGADVISGNTSRGKTKELDVFSAGSLTLTLRNDSRQYDPNNAASAYNGSILPMRRMQVLTIVNNTISSIFLGYVNSWQQVYTGPHSAQCVVSLTDAFKVVSKALMPSSAYAKEVKADSPLHWWRLGDAAGSSVARDSIGSAHLTSVAGAPTFGATGLPINDTDKALEVNASQDGVLLSGGTLFVNTAPITLEVLVTPKSFSYAIGSATSNSGLIFGHLTNQAAGMDIAMTSAGFAGCSVATNGLTGTSVIGATAIKLGTTYHLAAVWDVDGSIKLYVNGALDGSGSFAASNVFPANPTTTIVGGLNSVAGSLFTQIFGQIGVTDEAAFYNTALSATRIAAHASAALTGWAGDSPGTRFGRVLDTITWPTDARAISAGASVLQAAKLGQFAQDHLQGVADAEFGKFYVNSWGGIVLESRADGVDQTSLGTFVDSHNGTVNLIQVATPEYTDQLIRNDVTIQRDGGVAEETQDATSIGVYLTQSYSKTGLYHNSDDLSLAASQYLVANYKDPLQRVAQLVIKPREDAVNLFPQAVGRELTDWITVTYTPQNVGAAFTQVTVIEGIKHTFSPKDWTTTFMLSPADTKTYWKLGVTGFGELGVNTRLFY